MHTNLESQGVSTSADGRRPGTERGGEKRTDCLLPISPCDAGDVCHAPSGRLGACKRQQHDGRFAGYQGMGCARGHMQPRPSSQVEFFPINCEAKPSRQDLHYRSAGRLVFC